MAFDNREPFCRFILFRFSPVVNNPPDVFPPPDDFTEAPSGLAGGLASAFRDPEENTFLILVPGDIPRRFLEEIASDAPSDCSLCRESIEAACRGARSIDSESLMLEMGSVVDLAAEDCCAEKLSG